jgi:arylsulfatase
MYDSVVNLNEWEGVAGQPAKRGPTITYDSLATFDQRQSAAAVDYIKQHSGSGKPFFMDVNFIKMHNPTNAAPEFRGRTHLGDYPDSLMELDADIGKIIDEIRADAPNTIVIVTADNGAWLDAYPDAGTIPFRGEKGSAFEGGWRVPGIVWWPGHWVNPRIRRGGPGSMLMTRTFWQRAPTSAATRSNPGSTSRGNTFTRPRTHGWARKPTSVQSARRIT